MGGLGLFITKKTTTMAAKIVNSKSILCKGYYFLRFEIIVKTIERKMLIIKAVVIGT